MARKVFISVLGTGFYGSCKYEKDDFISSDTRFIQTATLDYIGAKEWSKDDAAYIFLTPFARKINWEEPENGTRHNNITDKDEEYHSLQTEIGKLSLPCKIEDVPIPNGKNEEEMWEIFETLFDKIEIKDELYIDLTHSFRYIPMLVMVFSNYVKFLKQVTVKYISYGNYEARNKETNIAPIVDLLPLSALQDWTAAADQYLTSGNVDKLNKLYLPILQSKLKDSLGKDEESKKLKHFIDHFSNLIKDRLTCQGKKVIESKELCQVINDLNALNDVSIPKPFKPVLDEITKSLCDFDTNSNILNGFRAAQWSFNNGLYQQCVTLLQETVVCYICSFENLDWTNLTVRDTINSIFAISCQKIPEERWRLRGNNDKEKEMNKQLIKKMIVNEHVLSLNNDYAFLSEIRNQYNHAGMLYSTKFNSEKMIENIKNLLNEITNKISESC
jgi:CRISPR-associated Csx2 family protein